MGAEESRSCIGGPEWGCAATRKPNKENPWEAVQDESGRTYYWHKDTDEVRWTMPSPMLRGEDGPHLDLPALDTVAGSVAEDGGADLIRGAAAANTAPAPSPRPPSLYFQATVDTYRDAAKTGALQRAHSSPSNRTPRSPRSPRSPGSSIANMQKRFSMPDASLTSTDFSKPVSGRKATDSSSASRPRARSLATSHM